MTFGERLYKLREERGWSQDDLAEKAEVSRQTVSNWENDKVTIDAEKLKRLAQIFGVGMDELYSSETLPSARNKKSKRFPLTLAVVLITVAVLAFAFSVVGLCFADTGKTSLAITLTGTAGLCIALAVAAVAIVCGIVLLIKTLRKK